VPPDVWSSGAHCGSAYAHASVNDSFQDSASNGIMKLNVIEQLALKTEKCCKTVESDKKRWQNKN